MKLVIFDIDGTLADTVQIEGDCFCQAFETCFKHSIRSVDWSTLKNVTDWGITEELFHQLKGREISELEMNSMKAVFFKELQKVANSSSSKFEEVKGARKFYRELSDLDDVQIAVATGSWAESARIKLSSIEISVEGVPFAILIIFEAEQISQDML